MRNPGIIVKLPDGRICIVYNNQPLLKTKRTIILNLVDEFYNLIIGPEGKPKTIIKTEPEFIELMKKSETIGYID